MATLSGLTTTADILDCVLGTKAVMIQLAAKLPRTDSQIVLEAGRWNIAKLRTVTNSTTSLQEMWSGTHKYVSTVVLHESDCWSLPRTEPPRNWPVKGLLDRLPQTEMEDILHGVDILESALRSLCDLNPITFATGDLSALPRDSRPTEQILLTSRGASVQTFRDSDIVVLVCLRGVLTMHVAVQDQIEEDCDHTNVTPHKDSGADVQWTSMHVCAGRAVCVPACHWRTYETDATGTLCVGWRVRAARLHAEQCAEGCCPVSLLYRSSLSASSVLSLSLCPARRVLSCMTQDSVLDCTVPCGQHSALGSTVLFGQHCTVDSTVLFAQHSSVESTVLFGQHNDVDSTVLSKEHSAVDSTAPLVPCCLPCLLVSHSQTDLSVSVRSARFGSWLDQGTALAQPATKRRSMGDPGIIRREHHDTTPA